jgi:hypothetical protein
LISNSVKYNYEPSSIARLSSPVLLLQDLKKTTKDTSERDTKNTKEIDIMSSPVAVNEDTQLMIEEHDAGSLEFSAYHYHHNREPYYLLFIKVPSEAGEAGEDKIYIEKIDTHSHRNKYVYDVVMPFAVMESNEKLKKYYDMSVMLKNTSNKVYYDKLGMYSKRLIQTYDTDSDSDREDSDDECGSGDDAKKREKKPKRTNRNWAICCDKIWKNMRVSPNNHTLNCYYNINPFTNEYKVNTEKKINSFLTHFNNFAKYTSIPSAIEKEIVANYNDVPQLTRDNMRL